MLLSHIMGNGSGNIEWFAKLGTENKEKKFEYGHIADKYANTAERDPKVFLTTSRNPSAPLRHFGKELSFVSPNAQRMNSVGRVISEIIEACRAHEFTDVVLVHEQCGVPDVLIISYQPFGPTAYFGLLNVLRIERQSGSFEFGPKWLRLWKLCIPPKNRHFLWRCCRDSLPVNTNLASKLVWRELEPTPIPQPLDDISAWLSGIFDTPRQWSILYCSYAKLPSWCGVSWNLLLFPNPLVILVHGSQTTHPRNIVYASRAVLDDNRKENRPFQTAGSATEHIRWIPPPHEVYKLNTDAGLVGSDGYGIGVVLWDSACRLN
ncbi:U3 small nucleolar ribonucleoprotein IMP4 [Quillaja saponaria]|uniref:U3 small nucleolar ribonucleoprotein IMP4 n=1 Tax=Quillaja saponaria TaxID=32244 RepID=A0AAD7PBA7_QUISA|nr:U3 small nucleolar ribonucleoprotein IMP4 [Quillaja saponaria]